jgi:hypothetical protein
MRAEATFPKRVELSFSRPENQFLIENHADGVRIQAARDNLSAQQKLFFVRYLAAEGYIPERYQWFADPQSGAYSGLEWNVDNSWLARTDEAQRRALRQIVRVLWCATLLWLALMSFAFVRDRWFPPPQNYPSGHE